jgi:exopolyphosphatase / guanosine-5'-triphosphate,3'-diphosphate pyrophosphatase
MRAAAVDVGSNSIKLLVAEAAPDGSLSEVLSRTLEVRISAGISSNPPRLSREGIESGVRAVAELAADAGREGAARIGVVATSAVRDASNGPEFRERARAACGLDVRILTGTEEANLIARGLATDPTLADLREFDVFDLGGGSLECLSFRDRKVVRAASLPLGCVRLTEMFVPDRSAPFGPAEADAIARHVKQALRDSGFPLPVPPACGVVGTGGTLTSVRAMAGAGRGMPMEAASPLLEVSLLRQTLGALGALDLAARKMTKGLAPERADVLPAALTTLLALAELGGIRAFRHSLRNLRWGLAAELLGSP